MKFQLTRFLSMMGGEYDFCFADGPTKLDLDPASPQGRILNTYFEGLPVLQWMDIVDCATGRSAAIVGGGIVPTATRKDKRGNPVDMLTLVEDLQKRFSTRDDTNAPAPAPAAAVAATESAAGAAKGGAGAGFQGITALSGETNAYAQVGLALRTLAQFVRANGPFDGAIGFSQGANILSMWLALIEAGVLDASWAAPRWLCLICATNWGWYCPRPPPPPTEPHGHAHRRHTGVQAGATPALDAPW